MKNCYKMNSIYSVCTCTHVIRNIENLRGMKTHKSGRYGKELKVYYKS